MANTPSGGSPHARWQGDFLHLCRLRLPEPDDRPGEAGAAARHFVETGRSAGDLPFCQARVHPRTVTWEKDVLGTDLRSAEAGSHKKDPP